jgi:hypothetical protein
LIGRSRQRRSSLGLWRQPAAAAAFLSAGDGDARGAQLTVQHIAMPGRPVDVAVVGDRAWVAVDPEGGARDGALASVDGSPVALQGQARSLATRGDELWLLTANTVARFDPQTGK